MVKRDCYRLLSGLLLGVLLAYAPMVSAVVRVTPDRNEVRVNEMFKLHVEYDGVLRQKMDWKPLHRDFHVKKVSQKQSVEIRNGEKRTVYSWVLDLMPKRVGMLEIPPLRIGEEASPGRKIQVKAAPKKRVEDFYIDITADPAKPYVQQEVTVRAKVYMARNLSGSVTPFAVKGGQAIIQKVKKEKRYREKINGRQYQVYELTYLIYPQVSGKLALTNMELKGNYAEGRRRISVNKKSRQLELNVLPVPQAYRQSEWLPAKQVILEQSWDGDLDNLQVGTPFTRRVTLKANGVRDAQLPLPNLDVGDAFKTYVNDPERVSQMNDANVMGIHHINVVMIPKQAGVVRLPEVRMPWWNTQKQQQEWATLAAQELDIQEAPEGVALTVEEPVSFEMERTNKSDGVASYWMWSSLAFLTLWMATGVAWLAGWSVPLRARRQEIMAEINESARAARRRLKKACASGDATKARESLLAWMEAMKMDQGIDQGAVGATGTVTSLSSIASIYGDDFAVRVAELNQHLYAPASTRQHAGGDDEDAPRPEWDGLSLWQAFEAIEDEAKARADSSKNATARVGTLRMLYPRHTRRDEPAAAAPGTSGSSD